MMNAATSLVLLGAIIPYKNVVNFSELKSAGYTADNYLKNPPKPSGYFRKFCPEASNTALETLDSFRGPWAVGRIFYYFCKNKWSFLYCQQCYRCNERFRRRVSRNGCARLADECGPDCLPGSVAKKGMSGTEEDICQPTIRAADEVPWPTEVSAALAGAGAVVSLFVIGEILACIRWRKSGGTRAIATGSRGPSSQNNPMSCGGILY